MRGGADAACKGVRKPLLMVRMANMKPPDAHVGFVDFCARSSQSELRVVVLNEDSYFPGKCGCSDSLVSHASHKMVCRTMAFFVKPSHFTRR